MSHLELVSLVQPVGDVVSWIGLRLQRHLSKHDVSVPIGGSKLLVGQDVVDLHLLRVKLLPDSSISSIIIS